MPPESGLVAGTRPTVDAPPELAGWAGAATAVHAIQRMAMPMTLILEVAENDVVRSRELTATRESTTHPTSTPITIDFAFNAFEWARDLADFPTAPHSVHIETREAAIDAPSIELPGRALDPLLWSIGFHAFGEEPAPWLVSDHRYRLRRWPSLSGLAIDLDQVRMIAMLGNAFATADELAAAAHTPPADARRLVNALSVAGILRRSAGAPALEADVRPHGAAPASGLFARLREKWGR